MKVICISGTPGTGKTVLAKKIAKKLGYTCIDVKKVIKDNKLNKEYDKKRRTYIVDVKELNQILVGLIKKSKKQLIIDSHLSHELPKKYVRLCIITKCSLKELGKRLKKRKYNKNKIRENLDSEIFDICLIEAKENKHKILIVDMSEITKGTRSFASAKSKPAISEHAQEHASGFSPAVLDTTKGFNIDKIIRRIA